MADAQRMGKTSHARNAVKLMVKMGYVHSFSEARGPEGRTVFTFTPTQGNGEPLNLTPYQAECYAMGARHGYDRGLADGARAAKLERAHHEPR